MKIWDRIVHAYWRVLPYEYRPGQIYYRLKCWAWKRYTTVKPRWLGHTWCDRDHLLASCMFEILGRFVEEELDPKQSTPEEYGVVTGEEEFAESCNEQIAGEAELRELWRWWNEEYLKHDPWKQVEEFEGPKLECVELDPPHPHMTKMEFTFSSSEAGVRYHDAARAANAAEQAMEEELKSRMKRLVDVKRYMWT